MSLRLLSEPLWLATFLSRRSTAVSLLLFPCSQDKSLACSRNPASFGAMLDARFHQRTRDA